MVHILDLSAVLFEHEIIKELQHDFSENEGGGSKAVWNFSENSSILV